MTPAGVSAGLNQSLKKDGYGKAIQDQGVVPTA
jgi:hypothetical protein